MLANLHTHTRRCRHAAKEPDRAWVEAAIGAGIRTLGFSDHCPWPRDAPPVPPPGFRSGVRMDPEETGGYVESLLALREEYAGRIRILIGFEVEHLPARIAAQDGLFAPFPVDYLICGQHYVGDGSDEWNGTGPARRPRTRPASRPTSTAASRRWRAAATSTSRTRTS